VGDAARLLACLQLVLCARFGILFAGGQRHAVGLYASPLLLFRLPTLVLRADDVRALEETDERFPDYRVGLRRIPAAAFAWAGVGLVGVVPMTPVAISLHCC